MSAEYKGFTRPHLESKFDVRFHREHVAVPYLNRDGSPYRTKCFSHQGEALFWEGDSRPQIPYGLDTLKLDGNVAVLTEGESCSWALRAEFPAIPVLGLPGASSWKPEWAEFVADRQVVYLSFDADAAGRSLLDAVWPYLPSPMGRRVRLPDGLDTRDLIQLHGGGDTYERLLRDADYIAGCTNLILSHYKPKGSQEHA